MPYPLVIICTDFWHSYCVRNQCSTVSYMFLKSNNLCQQKLQTCTYMQLLFVWVHFSDWKRKRWPTQLWEQSRTCWADKLPSLRWHQLEVIQGLISPVWNFSQIQFKYWSISHLWHEDSHLATEYLCNVAVRVCIVESELQKKNKKTTCINQNSFYAVVWNTKTTPNISTKYAKPSISGLGST